MSDNYLAYLTDRDGNNPQRILTIIDLTAIEWLINDKANRTHEHRISDVIDLQTSLDAKLPIGFTPWLLTNIEFDYAEDNADQLNVFATWVYLPDCHQETHGVAMPLASDSKSGLMAPADVAQIRANTQAIESLRSQGVWLATVPSKAALEVFTIPATARVNDYVIVEYDETKAGHQTRYIVTNTGTDEMPVMTFAFERIVVSDPIATFSIGTGGLIVGSDDNGQNAGKIYGETDGTGSVIGWNALVTSVGGIAEEVVGAQAAMDILSGTIFGS